MYIIYLVIYLVRVSSFRLQHHNNAVVAKLMNRDVVPER